LIERAVLVEDAKMFRGGSERTWNTITFSRRKKGFIQCADAWAEKATLQVVNK
jgi:hypothetical protein